ncbi:uncharacterized protein PG986_013801 [Apiospora aurea]|uniref:Uncharacterized protein n=1 Tax=Apiospora aurea TaxID=335848 RepID=A0ABR1PWL5_9PEZI
MVEYVPKKPRSKVETRLVAARCNHVAGHTRAQKDPRGFNSITDLDSWLASDGVKPFKEEFVRDYLASNHADDDASYSTVTNLLGANSLMDFTSYDSTTTPNKAGWSSEKHWTRFIWQMGSYAKRHATAWKAPREEEMEVWFWHGYEVVKFFKAEYANDQELENTA